MALSAIDRELKLSSLSQEQLQELRETLPAGSDFDAFYAHFESVHAVRLLDNAAAHAVTTVPFLALVLNYVTNRHIQTAMDTLCESCSVSSDELVGHWIRLYQRWYPEWSTHLFPCPIIGEDDAGHDDIHKMSSLITLCIRCDWEEAVADICKSYPEETLNVDAEVIEPWADEIRDILQSYRDEKAACAQADLKLDVPEDDERYYSEEDEEEDFAGIKRALRSLRLVNQTQDKVKKDRQKQALVNGLFAQKTSSHNK